jgi:hypothetical protein
MIAMLCVLVLMSSVPVTLSAIPSGEASFTSFSVDRASVNHGQTMTFSIMTLGAGFVFASVDGGFINGTMQSVEPTTGQTNWLITITPQASQTVVIHANAVHMVEGAAVISMPIIVHGGGEAIQAPTTASEHQIIEVMEIPATASNEVNIRIITNSTPTYVWLSLGGGRYVQANRVSESGGQITWERTYRPQQFTPHTIQISANNQYLVDQHVVTQSFNVALTAPYVPTVTPRITSSSARPTTINEGERTTVTIRTNLDVEYVWLDVDGRRVNARRGNSTATTRNWTADIRPDRTQNVRIFANSANQEQGAATDTVRITVRDRSDSNARVTSAVLRQSTIRSGDRVIIDVRTNEYVNNVWAMVDNQRVYGSRVSSSSSTQDWEINIWPLSSQTIRVYGSTTSQAADADVRTVSITLN